MLHSYKRIGGETVELRDGQAGGVEFRIVFRDGCSSTWRLTERSAGPSDEYREIARLARAQRNTAPSRDVRSVVEGWLGRHGVKDLDGPDEGPRTIAVSLDAAEELEQGIAALLDAACQANVVPAPGPLMDGSGMDVETKL